MNKNSLHPLTHVLICLALSSIVFATNSLVRIGVFFLLSIAYSSLRIKGGLVKIMLTLYHSLTFILPIALLQIIFQSHGEVLWRFYFLRVSVEGISWAAILSLRLATVILCAKALAVNSFRDFQIAFALLHLPEELSFMISYGVQLIPTFLNQIKGYLRSLHLRGIEPARLPWGKRLHVYKILAVSSLAGILNGSTNSAIALELRGFRSKGKRSHLHRMSLGIRDVIAILLLTGSLILVMLFG